MDYPVKTLFKEREPLVSVLVTNFNYGDFILPALDSCLNQTYKNIEIIICDDGSTDNSVELIENYIKNNNNDNIKLFCKANGGQSSALNFAFEKSRGRIICILDADDILFLDKIELIVNTFLHSSPGIVTHKVVPINEIGDVISNAIPKKLDSGYLFEKSIKNGGKILVPPASGISIARDVCYYIFPIDENLKYNTDGLLVELGAYITEIKSIDLPLAFFRIHSKNVSSNFHDYPNEKSIEKIFKNKDMFIKLHKSFLEKYFNKETRDLWSYENRPNYWENFLVIGLYDNQRISYSLNYIKELSSFSRKCIWYIIFLLPQKLGIKLLKQWWGNNKFKRIISKIIQIK